MRHIVNLKQCRVETALGWQIGQHQRIVGRLEWTRTPMAPSHWLVIDGKRVTWEQIGRMLMALEGFTLEPAMPSMPSDGPRDREPLEDSGEEARVTWPAAIV